MTLKKWIWRPDTCGCVLEEQVDIDLPVESRVKTVSQVLFACPIHSPEQGDSAKYSKVLGENTRKNKFLRAIVTEVGEILQSEVDGVVNFPGNRSVSWSFNGSRQLVAVLSGFSTQQKNRITNFANTNYPGLIIIQ